MSPLRRFYRLCLVCLCLVCLWMLAVGPAWADGPHIALHAVEGPYDVTVFSTPDPLVTGEVSFTALVQDAATGALLPGVLVQGSLVQVAGAGHAAGKAAGKKHVSLPLTLSLAGSPNPQLPGVTVRVAQPGDYRLQLAVHAPGRDTRSVSGDLTITSDEGRRNTVVWAVFLVLAMVILFLANQSARQQRQRHQARSR